MSRKLETTVLSLFVVVALAACGASQKQHRQIQKVGESLRFELAQLYVDKGAHQAAVPLLKKILGEKPDHVRARVLYGSVLRDMGLNLQAERELRYALELDPEFAPAHAALGILHDVERNPEDAHRHHVAAIKLSQGRADYLNNYGFSLYLAGDTDKAIAVLERALALDPSLAVAYNNLGFAYGRRGQFDRARATFRRALDEAGVMVNMAMVYEEHGRAERAANLRGQAYTLDPELRPDRGQEMDL